MSELIGLPSTIEGITWLVVNVAMFYSKKGEEKRVPQNVINEVQNTYNNVSSKLRNFGHALWSTSADTKKVEVEQNVKHNLRNASNGFENIIAGGADYFNSIQSVFKS